MQLSLFDMGLSEETNKEETSSKKRIKQEKLQPSAEKQKQLEQAMDRIRQRYGQNAIVRGSLLKTDNPKDETAK